MLLERRSRPLRGVKIVTRDHAPFGVQIIPTRRITVADVERIMRALKPAAGPIVTSALNPTEQQPFREAGFVELESLHLLRHNLERLPAISSDAEIRKGKRGDLTTVLELDAESFDEFWTFDRTGITSARKATPVNRYVVATLADEVVGYAITGHAGTTGFLQRVAVHPKARGKHIGAHLIVDALEWSANKRARHCLVNTQTVNEKAFDLYQQLGFTLEREQLTVLSWP